jgi:hypothetical protein
MVEKTQRLYGLLCDYFFLPRFRQRTYFRFGSLLEHSTEGREDSRSIFKDRQPSRQYPFDPLSNPTTPSPSASKSPTTMKFIRVFAAILAFGQHHHHNSFQSLVP